MCEKETCHRGARRSVPRLVTGRGAGAKRESGHLVHTKFVAADRVPPLCVGPVLVRPQIPGSSRSGVGFFVFVPLCFFVLGGTSRDILSCPLISWVISRVMSGHAPPPPPPAAPPVVGGAHGRTRGKKFSTSIIQYLIVSPVLRAAEINRSCTSLRTT